jgi:hypothetical protein
MAFADTYIGCFAVWCLLALRCMFFDKFSALYDVIQIDNAIVIDAMFLMCIHSSEHIAQLLHVFI